jgi:hypothetical protein
MKQASPGQKMATPGVEQAAPTTEQNAPSVELASTDAKQAASPILGATQVIALGEGYNSVSGDCLKTAIKGDKATGNSTEVYKFKACLTAEEVSTTLAISGSASVATMGSSGNAKASYYDSLQISTYTVTVVVYSGASTTTSFTDYKQKDSIDTPSGTDETEKFYEGYGDSFFQTIETGGEYMASFVFYCQTKSEQQDMYAMVSGSSSSGATQLSGDMQTTLNYAMSSCKVQYTVMQLINGTAGLDYPAPGDVIDFANKFPGKLASANGGTGGDAIISFITEDYNKVFDTKKFDKIAENRKYMVGNKFAAGLARDLTDLQGAIDLMNQLKAIYAYYGHANPDNSAGTYVDPVLDANLATATADVKAIKGQMQGYLDDPLQDFPPLELASLVNGTPALSIDHHTYWYRDGNSDTNWDDVPDVKKAVLTMSSIASVTFFAGSDVNGIETVYVNYANVVNNKKNKTKLPTSTTETHGNSNDTHHVLVVNEDPETGTPQFLWQTLCRTNGSTIRYTWIAAQNAVQLGCGGSGNSTAGTSAIFFPPVPQPNDFTTIVNAYPIGFHGKCNGSYLFQLGIKYFTFLPAEWKSF